MKKIFGFVLLALTVSFTTQASTVEFTDNPVAYDIGVDSPIEFVVTDCVDVEFFTIENVSFTVTVIDVTTYTEVGGFDFVNDNWLLKPDWIVSITNFDIDLLEPNWIVNSITDREFNTNLTNFYEQIYVNVGKLTTPIS